MDERLRQLERRWTEWGHPDDETAYLRERLRQRDLKRESLELAAKLGHEPARSALDAPRPPESIEAWAQCLGGADRPTRARAALVATRSAIGQAGVALPETVPAALEAAEAWIRCPCEEHARAADAAALAARTSGYGAAAPRYALVMAAMNCALEAARDPPDVVQLTFAAAAVQLAAQAVGPEEVQEAVRRAVVPYILAGVDPPPTRRPAPRPWWRFWAP